MRAAEPLEVLIVGTGFAGIGLAIRLQMAGIHDFLLLEKSDAVGGTWRDNTYPGVACDVPAHLYSFSFEPNPDWSRFFAPQKEILAYLNHCVDKRDLRSKIRTNVTVESAAWNEEDALWVITTKDGTEYLQRLLPGSHSAER